MTYTKHFVKFLMGMFLLLFPSCDGIFENIYDSPQTSKKDEYGFVDVDLVNNIGTIYVDASSYTRWIYLNFHDQSIDSVNIVNGGEEYAGEWDMAVHRYEAKTNDGSVLETEFTDLKTFKAAGTIPTGDFIKDVETDSTIITDMSDMINGNIGYAHGKVNLKLSEWLKRDLSTMPPVYTLSNKVYVVKLKDGTKAAVKLANIMNEVYDKGFLTINYIYPVEF